MPKVTGPLFSLSAAGTLGKTLIYQNSPRGPIVKNYAAPTNPNSTAQQTQRTAFADASRLFEELTTYERASWMPDDATPNATDKTHFFQANLPRLAADIGLVRYHHRPAIASRHDTPAFTSLTLPGTQQPVTGVLELNGDLFSLIGEDEGDPMPGTKCHKHDPDTLAITDTLSLPANQAQLATGRLVTEGDALYWIDNNYLATLELRMTDPTTFANWGTLPFPAMAGNGVTLHAIAQSARYVYVGFEALPAPIYKISLDSFLIEDTYNGQPTHQSVTALYPFGGYLYAAHATGQIVKIDPATMELAPAPNTLETGNISPFDIREHNGNLIVSNLTGPLDYSVIDPTTMTLTSRHITPGIALMMGNYSIDIWNDIAIFAFDGFPTILVFVDLTTNQPIGIWQAPAADQNDATYYSAYATCLVGDVLYFGTEQAHFGGIPHYPARIGRLHLPSVLTYL